MPDLCQFDYDVFISYGWAGIQGPEEGDRGWVKKFKRVLQADLSGNLGRQARIFLDVEHSLNGELPANLGEALDSSAIFLSILSPGACRPSSWCQWETDHFSKNGASVLAGSKQVFVVILKECSPLKPSALLQHIAAYDFLTDGSPRLSLPPPDDSNLAAGSGPKLQRLSYDISLALGSIQEQIGRTVFLAYSPTVPTKCLDRLAHEIESRKGKVVRGSYRQEETERDFIARIRRQLRSSGISVHLDWDNAEMRPPDWSAPVQTVQWQTATDIFKDAPNRCLMWRDPNSGRGPIDPASAPTAQVLEGTGFEYLVSTLQDVFHQQVISSIPVPPELRFQSASSRYIFIDCVEKDLNRLERLGTLLNPHGIRLKPPLFRGDESQRQKADSEFLQRCHGVAVYFGSRDDLDAFVACQKLWDGLKRYGANVPKVVLLEPADEPIRQHFCYPDFDNYPSQSLDPLIQRLLGGGP